MKITYHENGWTVIVNEDIKKLTAEEIKVVCKLCVQNTVVVFKNQNLTTDDQMKICRTIGRVPVVKSERSKHIALTDNILRVTGQKNEHGEPGLFGHTSALDWHANKPSNKLRDPLIWLYGASGTKGSRTSWINNILSYQDLDQEMKDRIKDIEVYCGYKTGQYSTSEYFVDHINRENAMSLVKTNAAGQTGLFFPFLQIFEFKDRDESEFKEIMEKLTAHILQEKYAYHHDWEDGDVVLSEQWLSIHKRWEFDDMENRVLHRIAFDYSNVYR